MQLAEAVEYPGQCRDLAIAMFAPSSPSTAHLEKDVEIMMLLIPICFRSEHADSGTQESGRFEEHVSGRQEE